MADAKSALLREAAALFREYERHHRAKGTLDADQKAEANRQMAAMCEAALASPPDLSGDREGKEDDAEYTAQGCPVLRESDPPCEGCDCHKRHEVTPLTPPEPEGEPVAWLCDLPGGDGTDATTSRNVAEDWRRYGRTVHHLFTRPAPGIGVDDLRDLLVEAFTAGCWAVHENYQPDPSPEFGEAAHDYAAQAIADRMGGERG